MINQRRLIPEQFTLESRWKHFEKCVLIDTPEYQKKEMKKAFFSGILDCIFYSCRIPKENLQLIYSNNEIEAKEFILGKDGIKVLQS